MLGGDDKNGGIKLKKRDTFSLSFYFVPQFLLWLAVDISDLNPIFLIICVDPVVSSM